MTLHGYDANRTASLLDRQREQAVGGIRAMVVYTGCLGIAGVLALALYAGGVWVNDPVGGAPAAPTLDSEPRAPAAGTAVRVDVYVEAAIQWPTATPTSTPKPATATPNRTPQLDYCGALPPRDGDVCIVPPLTPTPSPTMPACGSTAATPGALCQYRFTPTPPPTATWAAPTSAVVPTLVAREG